MSSTETVQITTEQIMQPPASTHTFSQQATASMESEAPTFTTFPKLPLELRLKIWKCFDNPQPRDIQATITIPHHKTDTKESPSFKSLTPTPPVLHICKESRIEGLKTYKTIFKIRDIKGIEREEIYFNPDLDTLVVHVPRWTQNWKIYTGGHLHLNRPSPTFPLDPLRHNIFRCQIDGDFSSGKGDSEIIVMVQPTKTPVAVTSDERTSSNFHTLKRIAGDAWQHVEYYV